MSHIPSLAAGGLREAVPNRQERERALLLERRMECCLIDRYLESICLISEL